MNDSLSLGERKIRNTCQRLMQAPLRLSREHGYDATTLPELLGEVVVLLSAGAASSKWRQSP